MSPPEPTEVLARTLEIVRSADFKKPQTLRVLFYGQSISKPEWTDLAVEHLRKRYPQVAFDIRNLALGGFDAVALEQTAERDIASFYPDLIVFHVYGDHYAYERIIRIFRSKTAADIIVSTDHLVQPAEPVCSTWLSLNWTPPPGCIGRFYVKQRNWSDFMSGSWIPQMAEKYNLAVEPRRERWGAFLEANQLKPAALLADDVHPNEQGWQVMADLFTSWFDRLVAQSERMPKRPEDLVLELPRPAPGETIRYEFEGTRLELLAQEPLAGLIDVRVNGKAPNELDGCWIDSRVSSLPNVPDWPAMSQVSVDSSYHREDRWTIRVTNLNELQDSFDFTLASQSSGLDGGGLSTEPFKSRSGRVKIEPSAWYLGKALMLSGVRVPEGATFTWRRKFICTDEAAVTLPNGQVQQRHVVATGLSNSAHSVILTLSAEALPLTAVRAYRPPLN